MIRKLLHAGGELALKRPFLLILTTVVPTLALGLYGLSVPLDLTFTGVMNPENPQVAKYMEVRDRYELGGHLILLLEGPDELLDRSIDALIPALETHPAVRAVTRSESSAWLRKRIPWIVERPVFDAWIRLVTHTEDRDNALRLSAELERVRIETEKSTVEGARILLIGLIEDPLDLDLGEDLFFDIEARTAEVLADSGVEAAFSGLPAIAAQDQSRTLATIQRLSPLSLILVLALFRFVDRRWLGLVAVMVPLVLAVGATVGLMGLLTGKLTVMETFFGVTVFGLGIDFAVHLIVRHREEEAAGLDFAQALLRTLQGTGRGVLAGAVTTSGAFFIAAMAPDPVAVHLGLSGGLGLSLCLLLMLTLLPALWVLHQRWHQKGPGKGRGRTRHPVAVSVPLLPRLVRHATRHPFLHLSAALLFVAAALAGVPRFRFETDLGKVFNRQVPALATVERVQELFQFNGAPWIVGVPDLERARRLTTRFEAHPLFSRAESAAQLVLPDAADRRQRLAAIAPQLEEKIRLMPALRPLLPAGQEESLDQLLAAFQLLRDAQRLGPPRPEDLPPDLSRRFIAPNGDYLVRAYTTEPSLDGRQARNQRLAAQAIHPDATSLAALLEAAMATERPYIWTVFAAIVVFVGVVLAADLRSPRLVLLALVPVLLGTGLTFGTLCWLGVGFNVMTVMVVPLIIGLGVDDGIHVVHRIKEDLSLSVESATTSVGTAIVMTTATTCSSFLVLLVTDHPGLESMALVMLIGLPACLLASVTTLPALAVLTGRRKRRRS